MVVNNRGIPSKKHRYIIFPALFPAPFVTVEAVSRAVYHQRFDAGQRTAPGFTVR